jgi:hypothetical protein
MKQKLRRVRQTLLLFTLAVSPFFADTAAAQSCAVPLSIPVNDCDTYKVNDSIVWFSFNSGSGASWGTITVSSPPTDPAVITGAELYTGTCTSLTLVHSGVDDLGEFIIRSPVTASTNYLIKVTRSNSSDGELTICSNLAVSSVACSPCILTGCQLICNPDLESYQFTNSSQNLANFVDSNVCYWNTAGVGTPDYFGTGFPTALDATNFAGAEPAHSGNAYGGMYCYFSATALYREYVQQQLQSPLVAGQYYTVRFWVSLADYSGFSVTQLGAYISVNQPQQTPNPSVLNLTPQVVGSAAVSINGWVPITGTFQAQGGEQWITIGNFDGSNSYPAVSPAPAPPPFPNLPTNPNLGSYYFIDDITLEEYPDPGFTWSGTCNIDFTSSAGCLDPSATHSWNFGDPASGGNNTSTLQNPSHIFTQNGVPYTVTHTITSPFSGVLTYTATVIQQGNPDAAIAGYQTNNCGYGTLTYDAPCDSGIVYTWTVVGGTPTSGTGCQINIAWDSTGGYVVLAAWDSIDDCVGYDTLNIPPCCSYPGVPISNRTASDILSDPMYAPYVTGSVFDGTALLTNHLIITGVLTIDVPITFIRVKRSPLITARHK